MDHPAPSQSALQAAHLSVLEGLGKLASHFGFNRVMGQLYGALLLSPDPLSLDDLMSQLGISKAGVSTHIRALEHMGIVREVWIKDNRRKYYKAESDFLRIVTQVLSSRELRNVNEALRVLNDHLHHLSDTLPQMETADRTLAEFYITRLTQLQDFFRLAQLLIMSLIQHTDDQSTIKGIEFK